MNRSRPTVLKGKVVSRLLFLCFFISLTHHESVSCKSVSHVECHPVVHSQSFLLPLVALYSPALCVHPSMMSFISFDSFTIICSKGDSFVLSCVGLVLHCLVLPSCFALPCLALPCLVLLCLVLCFAMPYLFLTSSPCLTLHYLVSICLSLSPPLSTSLSVSVSPSLSDLTLT